MMKFTPKVEYIIVRIEIPTEKLDNGRLRICYAGNTVYKDFEAARIAFRNKVEVYARTHVPDVNFEDYLNEDGTGWGQCRINNTYVSFAIVNICDQMAFIDVTEI